MQHLRIPRGKGIDMLRKYLAELGDPPSHSIRVKRKPISNCEMVDCGEGVGGGHSNNEGKTTKLSGVKDLCFVRVLEGGKSE